MWMSCESSLFAWQLSEGGGERVKVDIRQLSNREKLYEERVRQPNSVTVYVMGGGAGRRRNLARLQVPS